MRIWIVNHYADPPDGLATRSYDIARRLVQAGNPTTIFTSNFSHYRFAPMRKAPGGKLWWPEDIDGVRVLWLRTSPYRRNNWRRVLNMLSFSALAFLAGVTERPRPNVVIGVSVHPLAAIVAYYVARLRRARFFFEETDLWPQTLIDMGRLRADSFSARVMRGIERFLYRRAERIIEFMPYTGEYVESLGVSRDKVLWIPHGVELERYKDLAPYTGDVNGQFRVMFLGGFVASNSVDTILDAAAVLRRRGRMDVKFLLVGSGTDKDALIRRVREQGLTNVDFPAPVPKRDIARVMGQADAFIYGLRDLPLYRFGVVLNKLTDYLASQRPIIFFGKSPYDPVRDVGAGYSVPPGRPEAIADAIEQLTALTPAARVAMGRNGRRYLEEHHNIPLLADRLLAAMERRSA
jgi:glycosyltransferase involved in cell wall biosynthesis